jgi:uncharacterized protein (DUF58 family)
MGRHLNRAIEYFGQDTRGMLEGGTYSMLHTRSLELDDLRPYVPGDEIRDIDWRATARSGDVLVKRFVTEKHHKILLVCNAGRDMSALTPSGEVKRDVAAIVMGAIGLIAMRRTDEIGMVYGDSRGAATVRSRRGENHIEGMLEQFYVHSRGDIGTSDIVAQLDHVARSHRRRLLLAVVTDEPDISPELDDIVTRLRGLHELVWLAVADMPAVGADLGQNAAYDVADGRFVPDSTTLGPRVVAAYRAAEQQRAAAIDDFFLTRAVPFVRIASSTEIRPKIVELTEAYRNAQR